MERDEEDRAAEKKKMDWKMRSLVERSCCGEEDGEKGAVKKCRWSWEREESSDLNR